LLEALRSVGPDAPTMCGDWTAADVAAHLVVSERAWGLPMVPAYALRQLLPGRVVRGGMARLRAVGERQLVHARRRGWSSLLERLAGGPPPAYRLASVAPIRYVEEWIHHEDVRRAAGLPPRASSIPEDEALWDAGRALTRMRELLPGRDIVELVLPDGRTHAIGAEPTVRVQGAPGELLLYLAGRTAVADVTVTGPADDLRALRDRLTV
jgi:uncharacterized protein (TIGR03085 family)